MDLFISPAEMKGFFSGEHKIGSVWNRVYKVPLGAGAVLRKGGVSERVHTACQPALPGNATES